MIDFVFKCQRVFPPRKIRISKLTTGDTFFDTQNSRKVTFGNTVNVMVSVDLTITIIFAHDRRT